MSNLNILINPEVFNDKKSRIILQFMLDLIDNIPGISFFWNDKFYELLFANEHDEVMNLYKNNAALMSKIFGNFNCLKESTYKATAEPSIVFINNSIEDAFLKIIHTLIEESTNELPFINNNEDILYKFKSVCCSKELNAISILSMQNFIKFAKQDLYKLFWPNKKEDFDYYFPLLIRMKEFELGYDLNNKKYSQIEYSLNFKNNICNFEQVFRDKCLENFVNRIYMSQDKAKRSSLKDEQIVNSNNRRFYITRDNGRIHYNYPRKNCIKFIEVSLDHNRGL